MTTYQQHWTLKQDDQGIVWLGIDTPKASMNTLSLACLEELQNILKEISRKKKVKGLIIHSAKGRGFIAGADIKEITSFKQPKEITHFVRFGHEVFNQLEKLKLNTVAMIDGVCLGGGLELALACRYRVAEDSPKTRVGLPEVKLGIFPAWAGMRRLLHLVGLRKGLPLFLKGKVLDAKSAKKLGVVNVVVPERQLRSAAIYYATNKQPRKNFLKRAYEYCARAIIHWRPIRSLLASYFSKNLAKHIKETHYPAPFRMIDLWKENGIRGSAKAENLESETIIELIEHHETAKNLLRVFSLQNTLKSAAKGIDFKAKHVHVIGAGVMGGDIAAWCVLRGMKVTLQDQKASLLGLAVKRAHALFKKKLNDRFLVMAAMDRFIPDLNGDGIAKADVIIEAVFEDLKVKQEVFKEVEKRARQDAILATNTSSILLEKLNSVLKEPGRLVGIHFFNPVAKMQLVEVVRGKQTNDKVFGKALAFVRSLDRLPLAVKSSPGFLVNRVLMPYLIESVRLLEEGVSAELIDQTAINFGMPMGPIELADTVGLDVCLAVAINLASYFGGETPTCLQEKVKQGNLGRKAGEGFYRYRKGKPVKAKEKVPTAGEKDIADRLIFILLNEAAACLREKIIEGADQLDAGMIFGTGFAPFRGGPIHYAHSLGNKHLQDVFKNLHQQYGSPFKADTLWPSLLTEKQ